MPWNVTEMVPWFPTEDVVIGDSLGVASCAYRLRDGSGKAK
jgi:hypothetical protein